LACFLSNVPAVPACQAPFPLAASSFFLILHFAPVPTRVSIQRLQVVRPTQCFFFFFNAPFCYASSFSPFFCLYRDLWPPFAGSFPQFLLANYPDSFCSRAPFNGDYPYSVASSLGFSPTSHFVNRPDRPPVVGFYFPPVGRLHLSRRSYGLFRNRALVILPSFPKTRTPGNAPVLADQQHWLPAANLPQHPFPFIALECPRRV